ncbi:fructose bisphosphate aldolase [Alteraurantiacibacter aestuarii]|uniref:fructose-bisphosphate aldolase n=1 Tax=Alteraurantiacibacter aestuarii TaxID=650004 RepID=A0A844ZNN1_9SPHN|nr:fructose bisphosphate aldolase [Alteraurantiacibacter aestuarii]MXO88942.1 fructose bisphosphate aldolase [Alteraurantiacibacter aestuarii]
MNGREMAARIRSGTGFIAALDQSGGSTPRTLRDYGIADGRWQGEDEMFALIHAMRTRIITSPAFTGDKIIGAILFEKTMDGEVDGKPVPQVLIERNIVPFLKVDRGLEDEDEAEGGGVQLMKPIEDLDALLLRARDKGIFGTKMRSVIRSANCAGIEQIVAQQFAVGQRILAAGFMPILEPEYDIRALDRAVGEAMLRDTLLRHLDGLPEGMDVMLKLSIPVEANLYRPIVAHPRVVRVAALSGGYARSKACRELARNEGVIASFSRALLEGLHERMSDDEFDRALAAAIDAIFRASMQKIATSPGQPE